MTQDDFETKILASIDERNRKELYEMARRQQEWVAKFLPDDKPKHQPWSPPYDETDPMPDATLACAVTGHVDADPICTCAGCTAAKVRAR